MHTPYHSFYENPDDYIMKLQEENETLRAQNHEYLDNLSNLREYRERWWLSESQHIIELVSCTCVVSVFTSHKTITSLSDFFINYGTLLFLCIVSVILSKFIAFLPSKFIDYKPSTPVYQNKLLWIILFLLPVVIQLLPLFQSEGVD